VDVVKLLLDAALDKTVGVVKLLLDAALDVMIDVLKEELPILRDEERRDDAVVEATTEDVVGVVEVLRAKLENY
jgi:hypothetical protein